MQSALLFLAFFGCPTNRPVDLDDTSVSEADTDTDTDADTDTDTDPTCPADLDPQDDGSGSNGGVGLPDLVISEIDPGGYIELFNTTGSAIALSGVSHQLCSPFSYSALSSLAGSVTVPAGGYAEIPYPSNFSDTDAGGEVILYSSGSFGSGPAMLDFTCWGTGGGGSRKALAESSGKWSGACAPAISNGSLARLVTTTGTTAAAYTSSEVRTADTCAP